MKTMEVEMAITKITKAYIRTYSDNGQITSYVEWIDHRGRHGRTEAPRISERIHESEHMQALLVRARREGVTIESERW
jgi:hypothetical protein